MKHKLMEDRPKRKGQIKVSEILQYVVNERDLYPLPEGYVVGETVYYDLPVCVEFDITAWTSITKSDFAAAMAVKPSQISRWLRAGMPEREDGRLSYCGASEWVWDYQDENRKRRESGWRL